MIATDFIFDGKHASDYGLMIASVNNNNDEVASGGDMEYSVAKAPNNDSFTFYGSQFNNVLTWNISVIKNPCKNSDMIINAQEESEIAKWLIKTDGYRWFQFDQEGYEDIFYKVYINMTPNQVAGETIGFDLVITSDCAYGFSDIITKQIVINASTPYKFYVNNDINEYTLPQIDINGKMRWVKTISYNDMLGDNNIINKYNIPSSNAFASSTLIPNAYMPYEAFDSNMGSQWGCQGSPPDNEYIGINLGNSYRISAFALAWDGDFYSKKITLQSSNNGLNWTNVQTFTIIPSDTSVGTVYGLNVPIKTQFVRLLLNEPNIEDTGYRIKEFALFESDSEFAGDFYIYNANDLEQNINNGKASKFFNISSANITMDSENDIIEGVTPKQFNWYFLRLVNGMNTLVTDSEMDISLKIQYREIRRVIV